ncbi:DUF185-domain-containing protein [Calocera viscosa TUFC12733]|uniref:Protein arginine methyltransferase NDUFAF7 n=1 Tax=Calocera viscosa (strain TUFC12733) TaxID=1330018 RepID=A0A167S511_CALVF|nr:DUF185-domain-containing protein [Calocera viscosa TUFC12733]
MLCSLQLARCRQTASNSLLLTTRWKLACTGVLNKHEHWRHTRQFASKRDPNEPVDASPAEYEWNENTFTGELPPDHHKYPRLTAAQMRKLTKPPREVKMLVRDYIADALYNPAYGYFSKEATILSPAEPFDFSSLKNSHAFDKIVAKTYALEDAGPRPSNGRQLWHTPTELFKPWYGNAIAQCLTADYMLKHFPYEDFIIYEVGAGNGTLARNILNFLRDDYPDIYDRTSYRIIEISPKLAKMAAEYVKKEHSNVQVINKDILQWNTPNQSPCYFIATEVIDNFPHDILRYRTEDLAPAQCVITVDKAGIYTELYEPVTDPLITRFLAYRKALNQRPAALSRGLVSSTLRRIMQSLPFAPNLSPPEFIPTHLLLLLETLRKNFPQHRLLLSDFSSLPDTIPGYNTPVVQTRYRGVTIPCKNYLLQPGYFDIFFPTNFERLSEMYELVMALPHAPYELDIRSSPIVESDQRLASNFFSARGRGESGPTFSPKAKGARVGAPLCNIFTHKEFLSRYANVEATTLRNGDNPMLDFYENVKFLF